MISQNEMIHLMLRYAKVYTDLNFIAIPTMPLKLRAGFDKGVKNVSDGSEADIISDIIPREKF